MCRAGTNSATGFYTTYWQDDTWDSPPLQLPPFSPIPIVAKPLDIPDHLSSSDLQARRHDVQQTFEANLAVPADFTEAAPASTMTYLQEAYYFVPMYLASQLQQQQGEFTAALDWYRTVYDYSVPGQVRDIYYGLVLDAQQASVYTLPSGWLSDPLNPHAIAQTRRYAYTRYTVLQIVQCLFAYADSLFTTDTSEDDAQARTLYMTGLELLSLAIFSQSADPCAGLTIQVLDTPVDVPAWPGLLPQLAGSMTAIDSPAVLATLVPQVIKALGGKAAWPDRFAAAQTLITQSRTALSAQAHGRRGAHDPRHDHRGRIHSVAGHPGCGSSGRQRSRDSCCGDQFRSHIRSDSPVGRERPGDGTGGQDHRIGPRRRQAGPDSHQVRPYS